MNESENQHPVVSVIIPVYNGQATIVNTLQSVLSQTYIYFEIIIVDDGSDMPVKSTINHIKDARIRICRTERSNANIARNYGISKSKGEYIAMLDADDYWLENHLQDCMKVLYESRADGLYGSLFLSHDKSGNPEREQIYYAGEPREDESMVDYLLTTGYGAQTSTLFTTTDSMKDILWDPELIDHQDYDFVVRFHKKYKMAVKEEPTVVYCLSSGRVTHYETCIRFVEDNMEDINPAVYMKYNLNMYLRSRQKEESKKFAPYFRKEATRYREFLSYQQYISILDPQNLFSEWVYKLRYMLYILQVKTEI
jgi:glycosyltransferase involved in cell wall biosynthesis